MSVLENRYSWTALYLHTSAVTRLAEMVTRTVTPAISCLDADNEGSHESRIYGNVDGLNFPS